MTFVPPAITTNPQTITGGTYANLAATINTRRWRITVTPTLGSVAFVGGTFHVIFAQPNGGLSFVNATIELDDDTDALMISQALTWSAGQALTFTVEMRAGIRSLTIAGATTGNGTFTFSNANPIIVAGTNLEFGAIGGNSTFAGTIGSFDDTAPDMSWSPQVPVSPVRRLPAAALLVAALVAPPVVPAVPAPALSWAPSIPDYQLRGAARPLNVGGESAPTTIVAAPVAPPMSWTPVFPDLAPRPRSPLLVGGESAPVRGIVNAPAPALSWAPVFPDLAPRARSPLNVGGQVGPETVIPQPPTPGLSWLPEYPDILARPRYPLSAAAGLSAPPFAGGKSLTVGAMRVRQNILNQLAFSTPLTTYGTNITFTAAAGTTLTATAHGMINCAGPFTLTTTGTLPGGTDGTTLYYCAQPAANTFHLALSAANADSSTFVTLTDGGTGTHTLVRTINTAPLYSTFVSIIERGNQSASPNLPTDSFGNAYAYVSGYPVLFASFPASAVSIAIKIGGTGGNLHTFSTSIGNIGGNQDEVLASGLEIFGARLLQDSSVVERADGGPAIIVSNPVTTTAKALLIAVINGNSNVNQENFWIFFDGFVKLPYISAEGDPDPAGYDQVCVAAKLVDIKGTYTFRAQGTVRSGGGPSGGIMSLLAFQAQSSDLQPLDWNYPQADMPRGRRPALHSGETAPPQTIVAPVPPLSSWAPGFPDAAIQVRRQQPAGETAPPSFGDAARLLAWLPTVVDPPRARRLPLGGGEVAPPPVLPAPLPWTSFAPDLLPRSALRIQGGEVAPALAPAAAPVPPLQSWAPSFPDALARSTARIQGGETAPVTTPAPAVVPSVSSWLPSFPHIVRAAVTRLAGGESAPTTIVAPPVVPSMASWVQQPVMPTPRARRQPPGEAVGPVRVIPQPPAPPLWSPAFPDFLRRSRIAQQGGEVSPFGAAIRPPLVRLNPTLSATADDPLDVSATADDLLIVTVTL